MSILEQQELKERYYSEAIRYMDNAREYLKSAQKEGKIYTDTKYVKTACGTAYSGVLVSCQFYFGASSLRGTKQSRLGCLLLDCFANSQ